MKRGLSAVFVFIVLSIFASNLAYFFFDLPISLWVQAVKQPQLHSLLKFLSSLGDIEQILPIILTSGAVFLFFNKKIQALFLTLLPLFSVLIGSIIKLIVNRQRPNTNLIAVQEILHDNSFPSNHTIIFTVYFGFLIFLLWQSKKMPTLFKHTLSLLMFVPVVLIGVSRVYLGVHWPSDVFGGYLLGSICLYFGLKIYNAKHAGR